TATFLLRTPIPATPACQLSSHDTMVPPNSVPGCSPDPFLIQTHPTPSLFLPPPLDALAYSSVRRGRFRPLYPFALIFPILTYVPPYPADVLPPLFFLRSSVPSSPAHPRLPCSLTVRLDLSSACGP